MTATITSDTTTGTTPKGITTGQKSQIIGLFVDATGIEAMLDGLTLDQAQQIIIRGGEFKSAVSDETDFTERLGEIINEFGDTNPYADEELESSYGYPEGFQMKSPLEQLDLLCAAYPELDGTSARAYIEAVTSQPLPEGMDGWAVIPKYEKLAASYPEAVLKVFGVLSASRAFYNYRDGQIDDGHLRRSKKTADAFAKLDATQTGDFYVYPVQFGIKHAGKSVRRVRVVYIDGEFGNGAYEVGQLLVTHPERLTSYDDLWIDCPGDEFSSEAAGRFDLAPYFSFPGGLVRFGTRGVVGADRTYGSSSGLLPQLQ